MEKGGGKEREGCGVGSIIFEANKFKLRENEEMDKIKWGRYHFLSQLPQHDDPVDRPIFQRFTGSIANGLDKKGRPGKGKKSKARKNK